MRYFILFVLIINSQNLLSQNEQLYPYFDGENWGLSDGEDFEITISNTDSISPVFVQIPQKKKLYKSFNKNIASLIDEKGNILVTGYEDYDDFLGYKLNNNVVLCLKGGKVGVYDLDAKKEVIPVLYKKISDMYNSDILYFKIEDFEGAKGVINDNYKIIVSPDKKWTSIYIDEIEEKGVKKNVIKLNDHDYNATYLSMEGKKISVPVVDSNVYSFGDEVVETIMTEEVSGGLSCKHYDELITTDGNYQIKSCRKIKDINLPKDHKLLALLNPQKNLESDFVYVSHQNKIGVFSLLSNIMVINPQYKQLERIGHSYYFLSSNGKYVGLEYLYRNYDGRIKHEMITQPKFSHITKSVDLYDTFVISLPKNIKGYMVVKDKNTVYLPKSIKAKYGI